MMMKNRAEGRGGELYRRMVVVCDVCVFVCGPARTSTRLHMRQPRASRRTGVEPHRPPWWVSTARLNIDKQHWSPSMLCLMRRVTRMPDHISAGLKLGIASISRQPR